MFAERSFFGTQDVGAAIRFDYPKHGFGPLVARTGRIDTVKQGDNGQVITIEHVDGSFKSFLTNLVRHAKVA